MTNIGDGFKNIFLAGIGALAYTGEKGKEIIDQLVEKGEITLEQGRELNEELQHKAATATSNLRDGALEARMKVMTPEEREEFVQTASRIAAEQNAAEANGVVEAEAEIIEDVAVAAEAMKNAAAKAVESAASEAAKTAEAIKDVAAAATKSDEDTEA